MLLRICNFALRVSTLISKFALLFVMARFMDPQHVGQYGLLSATITYGLLVLGFEFYSYSSRELILASGARRFAILRDQFVFYGSVYVFLLPMTLSLFFTQLLPWSLAPWLIPLLVLEHFSQELNRALIAMSQPVLANIALFIRSGLWALIMSACLWIDPSFRNLEAVLTAWAIGGIATCLFGFKIIANLCPRSSSSPIDWRWIKQGLKTAAPFVLATLALRAIYVADRYLIELLDGVAAVAVYSVYMGIANALYSFLDASVFSFFYPKIVSAAACADRLVLQREISRMTKQTFVVTATLAFSMAVSGRYIVNWIDKPVYNDLLPALYLVIGAIAAYCLSMVPHLGLYALKKDGEIKRIHVSALVVFLLSAAGLFRQIGIFSVPAALLVSHLFLLVGKYAIYRELIESADYGGV